MPAIRTDREATPMVRKSFTVKLSQVSLENVDLRSHVWAQPQNRAMKGLKLLI
jgi:hypothetical protein